LKHKELGIDLVKSVQKHARQLVTNEQVQKSLRKTIACCMEDHYVVLRDVEGHSVRFTLR